MNQPRDSRAPELADLTNGAYMGRPDAPPSCAWLLENAIRYMRKHVPAEKQVYAGFILGQMEKVYLGACPAAMFNIPLEDEVLRRFLVDVAPNYRLAVNGNDYEICTHPERREIWVWQQARPEVGEKVALAHQLLESENPADRSEEAGHMLRGVLCGIPLNQIDPYWNPCRTPE